MLLTGILQVCGLILISIFFNISMRFSNLYVDLEPITFTIISNVSAAVVLLFFAGPGRLVNDTLKTPATWGYGIVAILGILIDVYLTKYVSATEMSLLGRMAIPVSLLISLFIFKRGNFKQDSIGLAFVAIGLWILLSMQPSETFSTVLILTIALGFLVACEVTFAEMHTQSDKAHKTGNMRDKTRVVGFVSFVTAMMFLAVILIAIWCKDKGFITGNALDLLPNMQRLAHGPSIWLGILFGGILFSVYRYMLWSASYKLKTDNVLAIQAFIPLFTLIFEWGLSFSPQFSKNATMFADDRGKMLLLVCLIITFGSGLSVFLRVRNEIKKEHSGNFWKDIKHAMTIDSASVSAIQHSSSAMDDYEIICATLEHTNGDEVKAAEMLNITSDSLHVLHEGKGSLALVLHASQEVSRRYRNQVANRDTLTGLLNRGGFMAEAKKLLEKSEQDNQQASLLFIDLDKFKPVNDTYGHDAGDFILRSVAERLTALLAGGKSGSNASVAKVSMTNTSVVTRLGGDEFCVLFTGVNDKEAKKQAKLISKEIAKPFNFKGEKITIGASVGIANYPEHGKTTEELLKHADVGMYDAKESY